MSEFCTKLPLKDSYTKELFIEKCKKWVIGGERNGINKIDYDISSFKNYETESETTKALVQIKVLKDNNETLVGFRLMKPEASDLWVSDCIYIERGNIKEVLIQLERKHSGPAYEHIEKAKKPYIVKMFLEDCKTDAGIPIDERYMRAEDDINLCASIINGIAGNILPVVYMSCDRTGRTVLNPKYMANRLAGLAHVICENDPETAMQLRNLTLENNPHTGYIGVFMPGKSYCRKFRLDGNRDTKTLEHNVIDYVVQSLVNKLDFCTETFQHITTLQMKNCVMQLLRENRITRDKLDSKENYLEEFIKSFDEDEEKKNERIRQLEEENRNLQARVDSLNDALSNKDTIGSPIYYLGDESEFYQGESRDLITDILKQVQNKYDPKSHAYALITSLIRQNPKSDTNRRLLDKIEKILSSGEDLNGKRKSELKALGFEIDGSGSHYKMTFMNDPRYTFTVAKTGSDRRNGKNLCSVIDRYLSIERKIN